MHTGHWLCFQMVVKYLLCPYKDFAEECMQMYKACDCFSSVTAVLVSIPVSILIYVELFLCCWRKVWFLIPMTRLQQGSEKACWAYLEELCRLLVSKALRSSIMTHPAESIAGELRKHNYTFTYVGSTSVADQALSVLSCQFVLMQAQLQGARVCMALLSVYGTAG